MDALHHTIAAMTASHHLWDRAAGLVAVDGRRFPAKAALPPGVPAVGELFDFMRDAELRFETLRMRIVELSQTAQGEQAVETTVAIRHPGHARVTTSQPGAGRTGDYEIWIADGDIVRTYASKHKLGTQRPIRNRPRGLDDRDLPGSAKVYEPLTALPMETLPETFVHPAGYCQNVLSTGECQVMGQELVRGRETIALLSRHPRTTEMAADRPDFAVRIAVDRDTGIIVRLTETTASGTTRDAEVVDLEPDAVLQPTTFDFVFPTGTTMLY
jgi:outer membrane lipoprotein-sorting protein